MNIIDHVEISMATAELVPNPGAKKSPVWEYFGFEADDEGKPVNKDRPICKKCPRTVATKSGNTSSLLLHLRNAHPEVYRRMKEVRGVQRQQRKEHQVGSSKTKLLLTSSRSISLVPRQIFGLVTLWNMSYTIHYPYLVVS